MLAKLPDASSLVKFCMKSEASSPGSWGEVVGPSDSLVGWRQQVVFKSESSLRLILFSCGNARKSLQAGFCP